MSSCSTTVEKCVFQRSSIVPGAPCVAGRRRRRRQCRRLRARPKAFRDCACASRQPAARPQQALRVSQASGLWPASCKLQRRASSAVRLERAIGRVAAVPEWAMHAVRAMHAVPVRRMRRRRLLCRCRLPRRAPCRGRLRTLALTASLAVPSPSLPSLLLQTSTCKHDRPLAAPAHLKEPACGTPPCSSFGGNSGSNDARLHNRFEGLGALTAVGSGRSSRRSRPLPLGRPALPGPAVESTATWGSEGRGVPQRASTLHLHAPCCPLSWTPAIQELAPAMHGAGALDAHGRGASHAGRQMASCSPDAAQTNMHRSGAHLAGDQCGRGAGGHCRRRRRDRPLQTSCASLKKSDNGRMDSYSSRSTSQCRILRRIRRIAGTRCPPGGPPERGLGMPERK